MFAFKLLRNCRESTSSILYKRDIFLKTHTHKLGYLSGQCHRLWWLTSHRIIWYLGCFDVISIYICCRWWFSFVIPFFNYLFFIYLFNFWVTGKPFWCSNWPLISVYNILCVLRYTLNITHKECFFVIP